MIQQRSSADIKYETNIAAPPPTNHEPLQGVLLFAGPVCRWKSIQMLGLTRNQGRRAMKHIFDSKTMNETFEEQN